MSNIQLLLLLSCLAVLGSRAQARVECDPPCDPGHCCMRLWLPGYRRQLQRNPTLHCLPLRREGDLCLLREADYSCPCGEEFSCQPAHDSHQVYGRCVRP